MSWKVRLLGGFSITAPDGAQIILPGKRHQALIAFVATRDGRRETRARVQNLLWSDKAESSARGSLRTLLTELTKVLGKHPEPFLDRNRTEISLASESVWVDTDLLRAAARVDDVDTLRAAAEVATSGDFLDGLDVRHERSFQEWKDDEQRYFRRLRTELLSELLAALQDAGDLDGVVETAGRLLGVEAANEDAHRALMRVLAGSGKKLQALAQYEECRQRVHYEFGTVPSPATTRLYEAIRADAPLEEGDEVAESASNRSVAPTTSRHGSEGLSLTVLRCRVPDEVSDDVGARIGREIIAAAGTFQWFRVLARSESFKLDIDRTSTAAISESTGAKYILETELTGQDGEMELVVDLIDGPSGSGTRVDTLAVADIKPRAVKDAVAQAVSRLEVELRTQETKSAYMFDRQQLTSYECTLLAISNMYDMTEPSYQDAEALFERAVSTPPVHPTAYSYWSLWKMWCLDQGWATNPAKEFDNALLYARLALKRNPDDALALGMSGHFQAFWHKEFEMARTQFNRSLARNPYSSFMWMLSSATYSYCGEPVEALRRLEYADWLCPNPSPSSVHVELGTEHRPPLQSRFRSGSAGRQGYDCQQRPVHQRIQAAVGGARASRPHRGMRALSQ